MKRSIAIICVCALPCGAPGAEDSLQFTHAAFVAGEKSINNLIEFPKVDSDLEVTVSCTAHATAKGRLKDARCSSAEDPDLTFTMAVSRRFNAARLTPALVNGKVEEVDFQFSVIFKKDGDSETISVFPHNMKNVDRLGLNYLGAQRYSVHPWPSRCDHFKRDDLIVEVAIINELGVPRDLDVLSANFGISAACRDGFISYLQNGRWIPALYEGKYVESVWAQPRTNTKSYFKRQQ